LHTILFHIFASLDNQPRINYKMLKSIALIVLVFGLTQASVLPAGDLLRHGQLKAHSNAPSAIGAVRSDASAWVDQIMANLRAVIVKEGLNTIPLPPTSANFSETILGVTYHGEFMLKDGALRGLETIHRTGVADVSTEPNGDMVITVEGGVNDGQVGYTGIVKFMNIGPTIKATGTLKSVRVLLTIRLGAGLRPSLDKLDIVNLGTLNLDIKGLGIILNFLTEVLVNTIGNLVKNVVGELLQGVIKNLLNDIIDNTLNPPTPRFFEAVAAAGVRQAIPYIR
jgi:hypothetical protein